MDQFFQSTKTLYVYALCWKQIWCESKGEKEIYRLIISMDNSCCVKIFYQPWTSCRGNVADVFVFFSWNFAVIWTIRAVDYFLFLFSVWYTLFVRTKKDYHLQIWHKFTEVDKQYTYTNENLSSCRFHIAYECHLLYSCFRKLLKNNSQTPGLKSSGEILKKLSTFTLCHQTINIYVKCNFISKKTRYLLHLFLFFFRYFLFLSS